MLLGLVHAAQWLARRGLAVVVLLPPVLEGPSGAGGLGRSAPMERTEQPEAAPVRVAANGAPSECPPDGHLANAAVAASGAARRCAGQAGDALPGGASPGARSRQWRPRAAPADDLWLWPVTGRPIR